MDPSVLKKLNQARCGRKAAIRLIQLRDGRDRLLLEGDPVAGELGEVVQGAFRSGKSCMVNISGETFFLAVHLPK
jgi:xanthine dehydrogenase accessory factor